MKSTGIVRRIDDLGRIVIPKELRESMDIKAQDSVEIYTENQDIIIKKHKISCIFCGSSKNIVEFKNEYICKDCLINIIDSEEEPNHKINKKQKKENNEDEIQVQSEKNSESKQSENLFQKILNFFKN